MKKKFMFFSHTVYLIMIRKVSRLIFSLRFMTISHTDSPNILYFFCLIFGLFHTKKKLETLILGIFHTHTYLVLLFLDVIMY